MNVKQEPADRRTKVQSVEVGMQLLIKLSCMGANVSISQLAAESQMPASKVHRYLRSLMNTGLVAQDPNTSLYRLGPEALAIGFAAMGHLDVVATSSRILAELRDKVNETCILCVWANRGPSVVRIEPAARSIVVNIRMGSVLPVLSSASGIICAAFQDDQEIRDMIQSEREQLLAAGKADFVAESELKIAKARETGMATIRDLTPGVSAVAAPVFDYLGRLVGVITALGPEIYFDNSIEGAIAKAVSDAAGEASRALGFTADIADTRPVVGA